MLMQFLREPGSSLAYYKRQAEGTDELTPLLRQIISWSVFAALCLLLLSCTSHVDSRVIPGSFTKGELTKAAASGDVKRVEALLQAGANINENMSSHEHDYLTPLIAAIAKHQEATALYLVRNGALLYPTYQGHRPQELAYEVFGESSEVTRSIRKLQGGN
ncbi:MAG: ankyrin repeat domain-containing protein [Bdellovibrionales bacterium]|nr:ankyrin repeat domain-containing protein [Bdellovibrionales bacterium]